MEEDSYFFWLPAALYWVVFCSLGTHMPKEHPQYHVPERLFLLLIEQTAWKLDPGAICKPSVHLAAQSLSILCHSELLWSTHSASTSTTAAQSVGSHHPPNNSFLFVLNHQFSPLPLVIAMNEQTKISDLRKENLFLTPFLSLLLCSPEKIYRYRYTHIHSLTHTHHTHVCVWCVCVFPPPAFFNYLSSHSLSLF